MCYIDDEIIIPEEPIIKVKQIRIINKGEKFGTIVFQYPITKTEQVLYRADTNCEHEIQSQISGGIKCVKCGGWYCA